MSVIQSAPFPKTIESPKDSFILKSFDSKQAEALWLLIISDRHFPERKDVWPGFMRLEQLCEYLQACDLENHFSEENGYCLYWENQMIGTLHLHSLSWAHRRIELGYWVHFEFEGRGFISLAIRMMEQQLRKMGLHRIELRCNPLNRRSCAVAERNQYVLEGMLRDHKIENGVFCDTAIYAKLLES